MLSIGLDHRATAPHGHGNRRHGGEGRVIQACEHRIDFFHIPTDYVVAQEASDVESSLRLNFLVLHNLMTRFVA